MGSTASSTSHQSQMSEGKKSTTSGAAAATGTKFGKLQTNGRTRRETIAAIAISHFVNLGVENEIEVRVRAPVLRRQMSKSSDELNSFEALRRLSVPAKLEGSLGAVAKAPSLDTAIDEEEEDEVEGGSSDLSVASSAFRRSLSSRANRLGSL